MKIKKTISANILFLGIVSLLMVGSIVSYQIYSAISRSQVSKEQEISIKPLDGRIKEDVIKNLRSRRWFDRLEINTPIEKIIESTRSAVINESSE